MLLNDSSEVIQFDNVTIPKTEQLRFNVPRSMRYSTNNIVKIDGKYYYAKRCSASSLIKELIGSYYAQMVGADCVDYLIGKSNTSLSYLYVLSEVFWKDGYYYSTPLQTTGMRPDDSVIYKKGLSSLYVCETSVLDFLNSPLLADSAMKLTAVDIKTGQVDRFDYNVVLRRDDSLEMEKIYDFGNSYIEDTGYALHNCYYNPFLIVKRNTISLWGLTHKYPQFRESAATLCEIPLYDALKDIEKRFNISIEDKDIPGCIELDKQYSKYLRKIK